MNGHAERSNEGGNTAPRAWPDLSEAALDALIRQPDFDRALMAMARTAVVEYRGNWFMNRAMSDRGRVITGFMAFTLNHESGGAGFTVAHLRAEAARLGFISPGRVAAWAATLQLLGFFTSRGSARPRRIVPTAKFFAVLRGRAKRNWPSVALIYPPANAALARLDEPGFLADAIVCLAGLLRSGYRALGPFPDLVAITDREAGLVILFSIMLRHKPGEMVAVAPLAREFTVSRAHVRAILQAAAAFDMLTRTETGGFRVEQQLKAKLGRGAAAVLQTHIFTIREALARIV